MSHILVRIWHRYMSLRTILISGDGHNITAFIFRSLFDIVSSLMVEFNFCSNTWRKHRISAAALRENVQTIAHAAKHHERLYTAPGWFEPEGIQASRHQLVPFFYHLVQCSRFYIRIFIGIANRKNPSFSKLDPMSTFCRLLLFHRSQKFVFTNFVFLFLI